MYGCCFGPAEAQGDYNSQLPGWLALSSQLLGIGDSSQRLSPSPPLGAWPPAEWPEERAHSTQQTTFLGVCLDSTSMQARLDPTRVESSKSCSVLLGIEICGRFQSGKTCCVSSSVEFGTHVQRSGSCGYGQSDVANSLWSLRWSLLDY